MASSPYKRVQLHNGCSCTQPIICPANYNTKNAKVDKDWRVQYYFFDPNFNEQFPKGRLTIVKGSINQYKTAQERKIAAKIVYDEIMFMLLYNGYNPITKECVKPINNEFGIEPTTPFIKALYSAIDLCKVDKSTINDLKCTIKAIEQAARELYFSNIAIGELKRKHIKILLETQFKINPKFTAHRYNQFRTYLSILFVQLVELEAMDSNLSLIHI